MRDVYRDSANEKVPCCLREADDQTDSAISLAENFVREPMHGLVEAVNTQSAAFLVIGHDGQIRRKFLVPRRRFESIQANDAATHDGGGDPLPVRRHRRATART